MAAVSHCQQSAAAPAASTPLASFYSAAALCVWQAVHERQVAAAAVEICPHPSSNASQKLLHSRSQERMFQRIKSTGKHVYLKCEDPHDLWQQDVANMCTTLSYTIQYKICKAPCCRGFRGAIIWPQCLWFATCAEGNMCKTWLTQLELKEKFIIFLGQPNQ